MILRQTQEEEKPLYIAYPSVALIPENNATPVTSVPQPVIEPITVLNDPQGMVYNESTGEMGVWLDSGQFVSAAELKALEQETVNIPAAVITNVAPVFSEEIIINPEPVAQVQYIGLEEQANLAAEGITVPPDIPSVVLVPVNEIYQPELFDVVVAIKEAQPQLNIEDVTSLVEQQAISNAEGTGIDVSQNIPILVQGVPDRRQQALIMEVINNNKPLVTETKVIIKIADELNKKLQIAAQRDVAPISATNEIKKLGFLDRIVEYIYNTIYV